MLAPFVDELDKIAPSFKVNGSQIKIIQAPADFYETLKVSIRKSSGYGDEAPAEIDRQGYGKLRGASSCLLYT